jgi:DNA-binding transcriptional ArsR family regulator
MTDNLTDAKSIHLVITFDALSEPNRLRIFRALLESGASSVGSVARRTGMSDALTSQHLRTLHNANLVSREKQGKHVYYRVNTYNPIINAIEATMLVA